MAQMSYEELCSAIGKMYLDSIQSINEKDILIRNLTSQITSLQSELRRHAGSDNAIAD